MHLGTLMSYSPHIAHGTCSEDFALSGWKQESVVKEKKESTSL